MSYNETNINETRQFLSQTRDEASKDIMLFGRVFVRHPDVFCPETFVSTRIFTQRLPFAQIHSFLEIGCGAGITAVMAGLKGCERVVATDINPHASANTQLNSRLHGVEGRVRTYVGNMFSAIPRGERFDLVYWNSNFVYAPQCFTLKNWSDYSVFDPGYESHRRYLYEARDWLERGGRVMLGFSDLGNLEKLEQVCREAGCHFRPVWEELGQEIRAVRYSLLEIFY